MRSTRRTGISCETNVCVLAASYEALWQRWCNYHAAQLGEHSSGTANAELTAHCDTAAEGVNTWYNSSRSDPQNGFTLFTIYAFIYLLCTLILIAHYTLVNVKVKQSKQHQL